MFHVSLVLSYSQNQRQIQSFKVYFCLCHMYSNKCGVKTKELLRNFQHYNLTIEGPTNKEILELGLELGSLQKTMYL